MFKLGRKLKTQYAGIRLAQGTAYQLVLLLGLFALVPSMAMVPETALGQSGLDQNGLGPNLTEAPFSRFQSKAALNQRSGGFGGLSDRQPTAWSASYYDSGFDGTGVLEVRVKLADSWHIYSTTQPKGGPLRTTLKIDSPDAVEVFGEFQPDYEPDRSESPIYQGIIIEEHNDAVVWTAQLHMPAAFQQDIAIKVGGLVCKSGDGRCLPVREIVTASYTGAYEGDFEVQPPAAAITAKPMTDPATPAVDPAQPVTFRDNRYFVQWKAEWVAGDSSSSDGSDALLRLTATPDPTFHVYREATAKAEAATIFVVTEKSGLQIGAPRTDAPLKSEVLLPGTPPIQYYPGEVTWTLPIRLPTTDQSDARQIKGQIAYMACDENSCRAPKGLRFTASIGPDGAAAAPIQLSAVPYGEVYALASKVKWVDNLSRQADATSDSVAAGTQPAADESAIDNSLVDGEIDGPASLDEVVDQTAGASSFPVVLLLAFIGGFVLNFMPCVLPVIGLKVMSFVGQGGQDRRRVFGLNLAYVAGICAVFAILAFLAIVFSFKWGEQFQYFSVRLGVTVGLFAFALSYFNVWEIPVPGMASGNKSQQLQSKEGFAGAFSKGIFTTLLATPCSGPLLGGVFGATLGMSSPQIAAVFAMLALGMSSPYLAIGVWPSLIKFLPKPGPWMETFKQLMAFLFLAAVAYFFYQFADENKFPVFVTLMGVWFGCWIIGQVPNWDALGKRLAAWGGGVGIATAIGLFAFTSLKAPPILQWVDYDEASLTRYQSEGKTVLVDFSAKWCVNCLVNLETAIDTEATRRVVERNGVVTMYADWTNENPEITAKLEELNSNSIPVLAIYPAGKPTQPIVLRDLVSQSAVIDALEAAGPSSLSKLSLGNKTSGNQSPLKRVASR